MRYNSQHSTSAVQAQVGRQMTSEMNDVEVAVLANTNRGLKDLWTPVVEPDAWGILDQTP